MVVDMHLKWPSKRILIGRIDLNFAYWGIHANAQIESTCIVTVVLIAFLCLCFPFGTIPAPSGYTTIIDASIYLENDHIMYTLWTPCGTLRTYNHLIYTYSLDRITYPLQTRKYR